MARWSDRVKAWLQQRQQCHPVICESMGYIRFGSPDGAELETSVGLAEGKLEGLAEGLRVGQPE